MSMRKATDNVNFRRLIKKHRPIGASDSEVDERRLVSADIYSNWLSYQRKVKKVARPFDIDHTYPDSRLDTNNPLDRLIGANVVNLSPMNASDNRSKGAKVIPELLLSQVSIAKRFMSEVELEKEERTKFGYLTTMYANVVDFKLLNLPKDNGILV